ncbi:TLD domain-containing protein 2 [Dictyocoela muelleri]|nr:TLD domain-containing protein 2 [Dictyocoela muelleri]
MPKTFYKENQYNSKIIDSSKMNKLINSLDKIYQLSDSCNLAYSTFEHGHSLSSLLRESANHSPPYLIIVKDTDKDVFGAFIDEKIEIKRRSFGCNSTFLFTFLNGYDVFRYSQNNPYFCFCTPQYLSFGCSDGFYGLLLDKTLLRGESYSVKTFENHVLSRDNMFEIVGVELWAIGL